MTSSVNACFRNLPVVLLSLIASRAPATPSSGGRTSRRENGGGTSRSSRASTIAIRCIWSVCGIRDAGAWPKTLATKVSCAAAANRSNKRRVMPQLDPQLDCSLEFPLTVDFGCDATQQLANVRISASQYKTTLLMLLPSCISVKPLLISPIRCIVGDHRIDLDLSLHVPVDDLGHVGAAARAAEGGALQTWPGTSSNGRVAISLAGAGDADDHTYAPTAVAALERLPHYRDIAGAVEGVVGTADLVGTALGHVDEMGDEVGASVLGVDEVGHAEGRPRPSSRRRCRRS